MQRRTIGGIMANLDRRSIKTGVKMGMSFSDFRDKYDLDRDELENRIRILYKNNKDDADEIIKAISKNEKKHAKETPTEYKGMPIEAFKEMSFDEFLEFEKQKKLEETQKTDVEIEVANLEDEISKLSDEIITKESEHKKWRERHREHLNQIGSLDDKLAKIESELKEIKQKYDSIIGLDNDAVERANRALDEKHELEAVIEERRQKLKSLKAVTICAYEDGTINPLDESVNIVLDDSGHDELYAELITKEECEDLRVKDIKTLARLIKIAEHSACDLEIVTDNAEIEKVFSSLTKAS